jgi:myb proto-oncogene protein
MDAKLTSVVTNTSKKKWGMEYIIDWAVAAALVPCPTEVQCPSRWYGTLVTNTNPITSRAGGWTADEDIKLKSAVQTHGGKNWNASAALVPGRTRSQCHSRWNNGLDPSSEWENGRTGKWSKDEDSKLKNVVHTHGSKKWYEIAAGSYVEPKGSF